MNYYSTKHAAPIANFEEAIFKGLPADNGLYFPENIEKLPDTFWNSDKEISFQELSFQMAKGFIGTEISESVLRLIISEAIDFEAPVVELSENLFCLELFHGPSMAFKDFGARFMAGVMSHFLKTKNKQIHILVATSGDTGGAVAQGFYKKENITVTILYPKGKVSDIQEKQLTTLGHNIKAIEIDGTFDDCQALVKQAFLDSELNSKYILASANSINIARLIPQAFYYGWAFKQLQKKGKKIVFSIPSGNFGNLSAGLFGYKLGLPVSQFLAACNANDVVPNYLQSGIYEFISPSIATISNAMDVGNPSNFPRMKEVFGNDIAEMQKMVKGYAYTDEETKAGVSELYQKYNFLACPHTAIGYLALNDYKLAADEIGVFLSTAHYAKFLPEMEPILGFTPPIPERLSELLTKQKQATACSMQYADFKEVLVVVLG
jgi:threonine synthase